MFSCRDVQLYRRFSCKEGSVIKTGQLQRHSVTEADSSAAEVFSCRGIQLYREFSCRDVQLYKGFSCRGGSVIKTDQL